MKEYTFETDQVVKYSLLFIVPSIVVIAVAYNCALSLFN